MADALGIGIQTTTAGTGAARGAAVLAGLGVQLYADANVGIDWGKQSVQLPDAARRLALEPSFAHSMERIGQYEPRQFFQHLDAVLKKSKAF